jgi:hypothetical protein
MRQPPTYTAWKITCQSAAEVQALQQWLSNRIDLERVLTDTVRVTPNGVEQVQPVQYRLGDYFTAIRMVPDTQGNPASFRLVFHRRPEAGRFWKDLMVNILQEIETAPQKASIALASKGETEPMTGTPMASQIGKDQEIRERFDRIIDFQAALCAGTGSHQCEDERGHKFDEYRQSGEFKKTGLDEVASTLMDNLRRLIAHATFPLKLFNYGRMFQEVYTRICIEHCRSPFEGHELAWSGNEPAPSEDDTKFHMAVEKGVHEWAIGVIDYPSHIGWMTNYSHAAGFAGITRQQLEKQIDSFTSSLVIQAWTVFESLSEDLWEAALNAHPTILAGLSGKPRSKYKSNEPQAQAGESGVKVTFNDLQIHQFDVKSQMGTILKESAVSFRSLPAIRDAYHRAFAKQHVSIDKILDDPGLQYAAAVRNLLVHKRGIVDSEFKEQISSISDVPPIAVNDQFPLTGKLCAQLADSCRSCAVSLVVAVHAWIIGHPEK